MDICSDTWTVLVAVCILFNQYRIVLSIGRECFNVYPGSDHHSSFSRWLNDRNSSHYLPLAPAYQQLSHQFEADVMENGAQLTMSDTDCLHQRLDRIEVDASLNERALCPYSHVLNYNPKRFPAVLTEVKCLCDRPVSNSRVRPSQTIECEPLRYQLRVLLFDDDCGSFKEAIETIGLACLPVIQVIPIKQLDSSQNKV